MFKSFFRRAAIKACLYNIRCNLKRLEASFSTNPHVASHEIFKVIEDVALAFQNHASADEVRGVMAERRASYPDALNGTLDGILDLALSAEANDAAGVARHDARICELFRCATGEHLNTSNLPWLSKMALRKGQHERRNL